MTRTIASALEAAGMVAFSGQFAKIPERMQNALRRYVLEGVPPGHFLTAVICNDLKGAVGAADDTNLELLQTYVRWFYNIAPAPCWGSKEKMDVWMLERSAERETAR
jgi:hypothetical protein